MLKKLLSLIKAGFIQLLNLLFWVALNCFPLTSKRINLDNLKEADKVVAKRNKNRFEGNVTDTANTITKEISGREVVDEIISIMRLHNGRWRFNNIAIPTVEISFYVGNKLIEQYWLGGNFLATAKDSLIKGIKTTQRARLVELLNLNEDATN